MGEGMQQSLRTLTAWKEKLTELKANSVDLPVPEIGWDLQKKVMEYALRDSEIVVMAYSVQDRKERKTQLVTERRRPKLMEGALNTRKTPEDDVVIGSTSKSYLEALRHIKQSVNAIELGITIKNARNTRNGAILLTVAKGKRVARRAQKRNRQEARESRVHSKER